MPNLAKINVEKFLLLPNSLFKIGDHITPSNSFKKISKGAGNNQNLYPYQQ